METQGVYIGAKPVLPAASLDQETSRMNGYGKPPSSPPQAQDSSALLSNGLARTTSKRRRPSGGGNSKLPIESFSQPPAAPEVPNPTPPAYRAPPKSVDHSRSDPNYPASFAERARILTGGSDTKTIATADLEQVDPPPKPKGERRTSLNRPIGGLYSEIQQHRRDSYPSTASGPTSPRRVSAPSNPQQKTSEPVVPRSIQQNKYSIVQPAPFESSLPAQPVAKRASAAQPPKKEWASDRSPLQNLEAKLEKRARVEQAEQKLRRSKAGSQRERLNVGSDVNRDFTTKVAADTRASRLQSQSNQLPQSLTDRGLSGLGIQNSSGGQTLERQGKSRRANSGTQKSPAITEKELNPEITRQSSRRSSGNASQVRRASQPQDRAVRFQGEDDPAPERQGATYLGPSDSQERDEVSQGLFINPASAEARAARREQFKQGLTTMAEGRASKVMPPQQQSIYSANAERKKTSAEANGGILEPVPTHAERNSGKAPGYRIPPQTASGIQAREKVGFGSQPGGAANVPAQRRHHLSDVLHRSHNRAVHIHEQSNERPQNLDEWRQGGVARLTATDFLEEKGPKNDKKAWWEDARSGRRRRSQGGIRKADMEVPADRDDRRDSTGKSSFRSIQDEFVLAPQPLDSKSKSSRARPYVPIDESPRIQKSLVSRFKTNMAVFTGFLKVKEDAVLHSAYSYSCPDLADHDPAHANHLCEPYVSQQLIQSMRSIRIRPVPGVQIFSPPLYLKCGPLLRYTGLKRDKLESGPHSERETWRGSVMIVTTDVESSYEPAPTLRLFPEPMELLPPPNRNVVTEDRHDLPSEIVDPIAGLPKLSRTGKIVYVKPADDLGEATDLSLVENDDGLFEETRTAAVPTSYGTPDFHHARNGPPMKTPPKRSNTNRGHRVRGIRLHAERGVTFWRFNLEVELGEQQARIAYSINNGPAVGFWVPARGHTMNVMFHSCNGFSLSVKYVT